VATSMWLSCFDARARISHALGPALPCTESRTCVSCSQLQKEQSVASAPALLLLLRLRCSSVVETGNSSL